MHLLRCLLAMILLTASASAGERVKVHVSLGAGFGPTEVFVQTSVEPSDANAALVVAIESDDFFRSSTIELDQDRAPRVNCFRFPQTPKGLYAVSVIVLDHSGSELARIDKYVRIA